MISHDCATAGDGFKRNEEPFIISWLGSAITVKTLEKLRDCFVCIKEYESAMAKDILKDTWVASTVYAWATNP